jgi:CheY-like chemotaxis protein
MMRRIRQRPPARGGHVPAIALSAYARAEDRYAALAAGFDEFLTKPAMPSDVVQAVAAVMASKGGPNARTGQGRPPSTARA